VRPPQRSIVLGSLAVIFWSTVATAFKLTLGATDLPTMLFFSVAISTLALFSIVVADGNIGKLKEMTCKDLLIGSASSLLNPTLYYLVLFGAYGRLPAHVAQPLNYFWPVILALMSVVFLGQRIRPRSFVALAISFLGVIVISVAGLAPGGRVDPIGITLALASGFIWSSYWILNLKDRRDDDVKLFLSFLLAVPLTAAIALVFGSGGPIGLRGLVGVAYIGLFEMGITFFIWMKALRTAQNTPQVSNLIYACPFLSLLVIDVVLDEPISVSTVMGLVLIMAGIILQRYLASRDQGAEAT